MIFVALFYLLQTTGELCLSPVGLSAMTRMAPTRMVGLVMGTWFFASARGDFVAALIAQVTGNETGESGAAVIAIHGKVGAIAVVVSLVVIALTPFVKRLMHTDPISVTVASAAD